MHEAHLMQDLMRRILAAAAEAKARQVVSIKVWLGALSHFSPEHFAVHFQDVSGGSCAEGAAIDCVLSEDVDHPDAQGVRLLSVEVR